MTANIISGEKEILKNLHIIIMEDVFLTPGITINSLAKKLGSNRQYLSIIINKYYKKNFNQLVNEYRIKAAVCLFKNDKDCKYTIESIATEVGFKNRTSFIQAFKKNMGVTPSAYREGI